MANILIVEDEQSLQMLLEYDLNTHSYNTRICGDGKKALEILKKDYFDLVILDWMLPSMSGFEVVQELRKFNSQIKVIILSAKDSELDIVKILEAGANDYIKKPFSSRELLARIKVQLRETAILNNIITFHDYTIDDAKKVVYKDSSEIKLTKTEYNILLLLANNINNVVSKEEILKNIWGYNEIDDTGLIDVHIHSLKKKMKFSQNHLETKRGIGYILKRAAF